VLEGTLVLDLSTVGPAARASRWLADYGADIVKVGPVPKADGWLPIEPPYHSYGAHRGMRQSRFDLKSDAGREAFLRLAASADVVIESFRPAVVDRMGIGYEAVRARNPRVVYCSTSGYGQDGPRAQWTGHDLNYLGVSGFLHCSERSADGGPPIPGATVADSAGGGMHAVIAILAALVRRERTGDGAYLDVSVADGMLSLMSLAVDEHLAESTQPGPGTNILTGRYACYDVYETRDGRWITVAAIEPVFWANLCRLLGLEQWTAHQTDDDRQDEIRADLRRVLLGKDRDEWIATLAPHDTCVAPVLTIEEVVRDEQLAHRGAIVEAKHPAKGSLRQVGPVLAGSVRSAQPYPAGDLATTCTAQLLRDAGLTAGEIDDLLDAGVVA
jgi:alpha-methylacyl-CoA racemase